MPTEAEFLALQARISDLEKRMQLVYRQLNMYYEDPNVDPLYSLEIQEALRRGNKIEAIKIYRYLTNAGLAEAKRAIDDLATRLGL